MLANQFCVGPNAGHLKMSFLGFLYFHKLLEEGPIFLHEEQERNVFPETSLKALPMIFVWFLYGRTNLPKKNFFMPKVAYFKDQEYNL